MAEIAASPDPALGTRAALLGGRLARLPSRTCLIFLGILAFLACLPEKVLGDPDTQWHIAVGARILAERAVPWFDPLSHTFAGASWIAKEWLSQLLLCAAFRLAGWQGVLLLAALSAAATFALLHRWLLVRVQPTAALFLTLPAAVLTGAHLLARPHILTFPLTVLWICALVAAVERRAGPPWWLLGVMVLWANLHAGFSIGFAAAGLLALEAVAFAPPERRGGMAIRWAGFLGAAVLAACLTPYGAHAMRITATLFGSGEPLPYITEWQPLALDETGAIGVGIMVLLPVLLLRHPGENLLRVALLVLLAVMTLRHARFLDLFALMAPALVAGPLARLFPTLAARPGSLAEVGGDRRVGALLLCLLAAVILLRPVAPNPNVTPIAALRAAHLSGLDAGPVYNDYDFGGFLIANGVRTFIDGRTDQLYLGGFMRGLMDALAAQDHGPFLSLLDSRGVTWALVRAGSDAARHLAAGGWERVHADAVAEVFARRRDPLPPA